ncbi:MAG TPA: hypothetical protein VE178_08540 [Silvibacterium sp.]|nr:hypothetical protein [Silvibacterium sp.]
MSDHEQPGTHTETIHLPAPTAWPLVLALGFTFLCAGLVTNAVISVLGGVLMLFGVVGWFRQVLPHEVHEDVPVLVEHISIQSTRQRVEKIVIPEGDRARLPVETYPILSGIKGGLAGAVAMIPPALLYGLIAKHSIWYPINLLGGAGVANWRDPTSADIAAFHWQGLIVASVIHLATCVLVGLLYGAMLPMLPRRPVLLGGIVAPVLWTGLLHSVMGIVNPVLDEHIAWGWFLISQVAFGIVAGLVVAREERIRTTQSLPFVMRMGIETPGLGHERKDEDDR